MAYIVLPTHNNGDLAPASEWNQARANFEHLAGFGVGGTAFSAMSTPFTSLARIATGTYTGNGAATRAVTGLGFQPRVLWIFPQLTDAYAMFKTNQDGVNAVVFGLGYIHKYTSDIIVSLDADGFTVGDGTPLAINHANVNARVYSFWALR